jgi:NTE family protein
MLLLKKLSSIGLIFLIWFFTGADLTAAAEADNQPRPKIGLALGGGSAMGFTHIGVLRWLEENRIPIDYIAGTSMGGLMGGCYALGMTPDQMQMLVEGVDWDRIFNSDPPYNELEYRRKKDKQEYPNEFTIGTRDGLILPNGLAVYQVYFLLSKIALPYSLAGNFDQLPIPFRCVATDVRNSQAVILQDGSLAEALRATMSIPGFFAPVERDGQLLCDGGLVDNVPADVVKTMGADFVIAVNCNESNAGKDLRRLDSFLLSVVNTVIVKNTNQALRSADLVIRPQLDGISYLDWKQAAVFINAGYQAAASRAEELRKLALAEPAWQEYMQWRAGRRRLEPVIPTDVAVFGTNRANRDYILSLLRPFANHPVEPSTLEKVLTKIMGSGFYESIRYEYQMQADEAVLVVTVKEKAHGPPFIGFAFQGNMTDDRFDFDVRTRTTAFNIWGKNSELRVDLALGLTPEVEIELYRPFAKSGWFVAPRFAWEKSLGSYYQSGTRVNDFKARRVAVRLDLGYSFSRFSELRLGYELGEQKADAIVGQPLMAMDGTTRKLGVVWAYSKAENDPPLQKGINWNWRADWYLRTPLAQGEFGLAETTLKWIFPARKRDVILTRVAVGASLKGTPPFLQRFTLGGPLRLAAYDADELRDANYWLGTLGYLKCIGRPFWGGKPIYAGVFLENGGVGAEWSHLHGSTDVAVGIIASTSLGLAYLGSSFGGRHQGRIEFALGRPL